MDGGSSLKIAYLHYLYGKQAGLHHARQFAAAAQKLGADLTTHAMHPLASSSGEEGDSSGGPSTKAKLRAFLKQHLGRYLHEPKELLMTWSYTRREIARLSPDPPDVLLIRNGHLNQSAIPLARRLQRPLVLEVNAPPEEARDYFDQYWHIPWLPESIEGWKLRRADGLVVVSSWLERHLVENYGIDPEKITMASNGADLEVFHPELEPDPTLPSAFRSSVVVGFIGSFLKWHGSDFLTRLATEVGSEQQDVHFLFVGTGPGVEEVRQGTAGLGDRVLFTGRVEHHRVPALVAAIDIAVMPGSNPYGSPLKVSEWMAAGKAVVAPRYVPLEDVIDHGEHGLLFPPQDGDALVDSVRRLAHDEALRRRLGQAAAERARTSLSWEHNAERVLGACRKAQEVHRRRAGR